MKLIYLITVLLITIFSTFRSFAQSDTISIECSESNLRKTYYYEYYISYTNFFFNQDRFDFINIGIFTVDNNKRFISPLDQTELSIGINKGNNLLIQSNLIGIRNNTGKILGIRTYNDIMGGLILLYQTDAKKLNLGIKAEGKLALGYQNFYIFIGIGYIHSEIGIFSPISFGLTYRYR